MQENPHVTAEMISEAVGITKRRVESNIKRLRTLGVVERVGSRKSGSWIVNKR